MTRVARGLTQRVVAGAAAMGVRHLQRLEYGERLTRASTLERLAAAMADDDQEAAQLLARWLAIAGVAIADESAFPDRVEHRRKRRQAQLTLNQHRLTSVARIELLNGNVVERRVADYPDGGRGRKRSLTYVWIDKQGSSVEIEPWQELLDGFAAVPVKWSRPAR